MAEALKRPGGELASRPLHFFWVVDCSGSMYGEKIGTVNHAIQSTIPEMVDAAKDNPNAQLLVRTLKFSTGATWLSARDFYHCHWQTCNRRVGDPVTHVLFDAECVPDAPVFLLPLCAVFPQHSDKGTGSVVGETLSRREQE